MEASKVNSHLLERLLKEIGASGDGPAWVESWNALASEGWSDVEDMIDSVFRDDPVTSGKVKERYRDVAASLEGGLRP